MSLCGLDSFGHEAWPAARHTLACGDRHRDSRELRFSRRALGYLLVPKQGLVDYHFSRMFPSQILDKIMICMMRRLASLSA